MRANNNKKVVQLLVAVCAAVMMTMMTASDAAPAAAAAAAAAAASAVRRTVCPFTYVVTSQWSYGFVGQVTLTDSALFLPRVTFVVVFPTSVHLYGWWNADMVEPSVPIGGQVSGTHFRFLKGDWQQGFGFSVDQTSAPVTPTITIEGICDPIPTTAAVTTTVAVTTTTGAVTTTTTGAVTTSTAAVTTSTAAVTTSTAAVTTSTAAVTTSSAATCPPPPPPAPATCPCNGLRVLKYRASIASRYAALGLHAVNLGGECIDGVYVHTDSQCIGSTPLSEIDNLAVQHWNQREVRDGVTGINLQMDNYLVLANSGGALGSADAQEPVISNVFQLGRSSSPLDSGLVCSDMFRLASIPGENTPFFTSYEETGDFSPEAQAMNDQYMAANRINVTPSQFCACIADAKVAVSEINTIKPRITDVNWNLKGTVPDLQVYFDEVAASLGVSC